MTITDQASIIARLRSAGRDELIHYAGAMHRNPAAAAMIREYLADPAAPEHVLTARRMGLTARHVDEARQSYDPAARARLSTDYYGSDGWPMPGVPDVAVHPDGTVSQSMERPGDRQEI